MHQVVIIGGGFGGLQVAQRLKHPDVQVTLVDRRNFHLFQPLLYQVATGSLSPANIAAPLRMILRRRTNVDVRLGNVTGFDVAGRRVLLDDTTIPYDTLIVAAGAKYNYFGHDGWQALAPSLKSIEDAVEIRSRIMRAFEAADGESDAERRAAQLRFVIVGGGPTGVEMAGALADIVRQTVRKQFRHLPSAEVEILLVEGHSRLLHGFPPKLADRAAGALERLGVKVHTGWVVTQVDADHVQLERGAERMTIATHTVLWTAGVRAVSLGATLADATGVKTDAIGRVMVEPDLSLAGHPEIFVIGDLAHCEQDGQPLPGLAPVAIQQGRYVAGLIESRLRARPTEPFSYHDTGIMATIGRGSAIARLKGFELSGFAAWLIWLFVHLVQIVTFTNRVLIFVQWAWLYVFHQRSAALITGPDDRAPADGQRPPPADSA